ncbi:MAG: hypothetical protein LBI56_04425 [Puniceicoccales bacterium]|jgi:hypothetical protein|nr:hypothetical protein [Puniceicoccales bacterium]
MKIEGILEKLQDAVEKRLLSLNELRGIPILTYKQSDLHSVVQADVKSGGRTAILLMPPIPSHIHAHVRGPVFGNVAIELKIVEHAISNGCGKSLLFLAEAVMQSLHMWHPGIGDVTYQLELAPGVDSCKADRRDDVNYFTMRFTMPCHLKSLQTGLAL